MAFLAFPKEVGGSLWLTNSVKRVGRGSRRWVDVPGHDCGHQPLIHEVRAVLLTMLLILSVAEAPFRLAHPMDIGTLLQICLLMSLRHYRLRT